MAIEQVVRQILLQVVPRVQFKHRPHVCRRDHGEFRLAQDYVIHPNGQKNLPRTGTQSLVHFFELRAESFRGSGPFFHGCRKSGKSTETVSITLPLKLNRLKQVCPQVNRYNLIPSFRPTAEEWQCHKLFLSSSFRVGK